MGQQVPNIKVAALGALGRATGARGDAAEMPETARLDVQSVKVSPNLV